MTLQPDDHAVAAPRFREELVGKSARLSQCLAQRGTDLVDVSSGVVLEGDRQNAAHVCRRAGSAAYVSDARCMWRGALAARLPGHDLRAVGLRRLPACAKGAENYCHVAAERGIVPPGLGAPGAMAEYMLVDHERHLVPLGDLDPVENVSLTDAGLTPYHAIKPSLPALVPGTIAVVIGAGGLGHIGIQILRAMSPATVVALDVSDEKLQLAKDVGAHHAFRSDESAEQKIRALNGGRGATAVFDFDGIEPTTSMAAKLTHHDSEIVIVGVGAGAVPVGIFTLPWETKARAPYWGSRSELFEVLDLARSGMIHVETERFSLDDAPKAYERMHAGTLRGRAVIVP